MTTNGSLFDRAVTRLLGPGYGADMPFLFRYDWAMPVAVIGGVAVWVGVVILSVVQGWAQVLMWVMVGIGALAVPLLVWMFIDLHRRTRGPLPALDPTPRTARVVLRADAEKWAATARTPHARAQILRWAKREHIARTVTIAGLIGVCVWPVVTVGHLIWMLVTGREQRFAPWGWTFLGLLIFVAVAAVVHNIMQDRRERAMYADGQTCLGRVVEITAIAPDPDGFTRYLLTITAELPGPITIRREIQRDHEVRDPEKWVGRTARFRHNTLDPDDLGDILLLGFTEPGVPPADGRRP